jgi:hypothetical protein
MKSKIFKILLLFFILALVTRCIKSNLITDLENTLDQGIQALKHEFNELSIDIKLEKEDLFKKYYSSSSFLHSNKNPEELLNKIKETTPFNIISHEVKTKDGYLLTAWNISLKASKEKLFNDEFLKSNKEKFKQNFNETKKVVLLQHGLLDDSYTWLALKENSLANLLLEEGYDVWLSNSRGNIFSKKHIDPSHDSSKENSLFWDFSFDEMAEFDIVANINYILEYTKQEKLIYIGHSQGTLQFYLQYSLNPEFLSSKVEKYVSIGTVFTLFNSVSNITNNFYINYNYIFTKFFAHVIL